MKLLHVIAGAEVGGAETYAQDAILALQARGVRQTVLTRPWPAVMARYAEAGVDARPFSFSRLDLLKLAPGRIRRLARDLGVDLVHAWMQRAGSFIPANMPCPVIGWFGDYYDLKYFRHADAYIGVTRDIASYIKAQGRPADRVFTVNTFGTMPPAAPVSRASLNTPDGVPLLLVLVATAHGEAAPRHGRSQTDTAGVAASAARSARRSGPARTAAGGRGIARTGHVRGRGRPGATHGSQRPHPVEPREDARRAAQTRSDAEAEGPQGAGAAWTSRSTSPRRGRAASGHCAPTC